MWVCCTVRCHPPVQQTRSLLPGSACSELSLELTPSGDKCDENCQSWSLPSKHNKKSHRGRDRATDIQMESMAAKRERQHPDSNR
jgi:hypothetical protein